MGGAGKASLGLAGEKCQWALGWGGGRGLYLSSPGAMKKAVRPQERGGENRA